MKKILTSWLARQIFKGLALLPGGAAVANPEGVNSTAGLLTTVILLAAETAWSKVAERKAAKEPTLEDVVIGDSEVVPSGGIFR